MFYRSCKNFFFPLFVEVLQTVNYGIGGHYAPHFDYANSEEHTNSNPEWGNRMATLLYYVSNNGRIVHSFIDIFVILQRVTTFNNAFLEEATIY